ncbi:MAG: hypothetical protein IJ289_01995 [Clostridia bacterium]|nr:hypothetical protein [Clostridia bacterium]
MAIRCPKCKGTIPDGEMFCRYCGFSLAKHSGALERIEDTARPVNNVQHNNVQYGNNPGYPVQGMSQQKPPAGNNFQSPYGNIQRPAGQQPRQNYAQPSYSSNSPYGKQQHNVPPANMQRGQNNQPFYGQPYQNQQQQAFVPPAQPAPSGEAVVPQKNNNNLYIILGVVGAVFLIAIIAIICVSLSGGDKEDTYNDYNGGYESEDGYGSEYQDYYDNVLSNGLSVDLGNNYVDNSSHGNYNEEFYAEPEFTATGTSSVPERTIMVYIVGSNLESEGGAATKDLQEMMNSGFNEDKVNVLVCTGGSNFWYTTGVSSNNNSIFEVTGGKLVEKKKLGSASMADVPTLSSFVSYCVTNYPADEYGLILWNHGGGPIHGFGHDEVYNDIFSIKEIADALSKASFGNNRKLEFIGFDACLMASIETAWCYRNYANYLIASEENEPGTGWDYGFLGQLDKCDDGADVGTLIIDSYFSSNFRTFKDNSYNKCDLTLSCVNINEIYDVVSSIDTLFSKADSGIDNGQFSTISRSRYQAKSFAVATGDNYDLIDLGHFASLLSGTYSSEVSALNTALSDYIVYSKSNVAQANGVSIYHPYYDKVNMTDYVNYYNTEVSVSDTYSDYIANFTDTLITGGKDASNWRSFSSKKGETSLNKNKNEITMQLTPEQVAAFSGAKYHIFRVMDPSETFSGYTEYRPIFSGYDVTLDDNGVLSASYSGKAVFGIDGKTGEVSEAPLAMTQIFDGVYNNKYEFSCIFSAYSAEDISDWKTDAVDWQMEIHNGVPILMNPYLMNSDIDANIPSRIKVNCDEYDAYQFINSSYSVETDSDGNVNFISTGSIYGYEFLREDGFTIECRDITDKENYRVVFIVDDIYGNSYTSDFMTLPE